MRLAVPPGAQWPHGVRRTPALFSPHADPRHPHPALQGRRPHHPARDPARLLPQAPPAPRAPRGRKGTGGPPGARVSDPGVPLGRGRPAARCTSMPTCRRESPTVRGFISLLARTLDGVAPEDVARVPDDLLDQLGLSETLGHDPHPGTHRHPAPDQALRGRRRLMLGVLELAGQGQRLPPPPRGGLPPRRRRRARRRAGHPAVRAPRRRRDRRRRPRPGGKGRGPSLEKVTAINGRPPEKLRERPEFTRLGAIHPNEQLRLECGLVRQGQPDFTNRVIDLLCPLGKGQRALIVAPAKAGKTMVLQSIAEGIERQLPPGRRSSSCWWTSARRRCSRWRRRASAR